MATLFRGSLYKDSTLTTGTGTFTVDGVAWDANSRAFDSSIPNFSRIRYVCRTTDGVHWEVGYGTWTFAASTVFRDVVLESSNSNSLVNFPAGKKVIYIAPTPDDFDFYGTTVNGNWGPRDRVNIVLNEVTTTTPQTLTTQTSYYDGQSIGYTNSSRQIVVFRNGTTSNSFKHDYGLVAGHHVLLPGMSAEYRYGNGQWRQIATVGPESRLLANNYVQQCSNVGTAPSNLGIPHTSNGGTISTPALASGLLRTTTNRHRGATGTTAGSQSGSRAGKLMAYGGELVSGRTLGGYCYRSRFGYSALPSNACSSFVGLNGVTTAPGNVNISTLPNILGVGMDAGDTNLFFMYNDASGTATRVDTGITASTSHWYEVLLYCHPNTTDVSICFQRLDDLSVAPYVAVATTNVPAASALLSPLVWICNRAAAVDYQIEWNHQQLLTS